jgi:mRNA interferase MazF
MLKAGDLVWVDFDPSIGHEQAARRPALIVSEGNYNQMSSFVLVCPITRSPKPWPFQTSLPDTLPIAGRVIVDQIKSIDKRRVVSPAVGRIEESKLAEIRGLLAALLGFANVPR